MKEEITGTAEIREIFKISKVGQLLDVWLDGKNIRSSKIRLFVKGVVFTGELLP
jgi:translation initiation factor IF-2